MERQRSFSIKSTRFLVFSFTICFSLIFLAFFSVWVIKSTPSISIYQQTHIQLNQSVFNLTLEPITVQSLTGYNRNFSATDVKYLILTDTQLNGTENTTGFLQFSDFKDIRREENDTGVRDNEVNSSTRGPGRAPAPYFEIEVQIDERIEEKETRAAKVEKIELSSNQQIKKEEIGTTSVKRIEDTSDEKIEEKRTRSCDITKGRWVYDESYPLYTNSSCPFIDEGFNCMSNGRLDQYYMKWKWQPQDCDLPRFNATKMLESIRGKRLVFVGDSINRNQWESMLCMLMGAVRDPKKVYETHGRRITKEKGNYSFKFVDYKCTVEYYVSHFLVHEGKARVGQKRVQTLRIDSIDRGSSRWRGADILIFNTAHYYVYRGGQWNSGGHCREATRPLNETSSFIYPEKNVIAEEVIKQMKTHVTLLNITSLSECRIEGHPSRYGRKPDKQFSSSGEDCSHWCLPGVPIYMHC